MSVHGRAASSCGTFTAVTPDPNFPRLLIAGWRRRWRHALERVAGTAAARDTRPRHAVTDAPLAPNRRCHRPRAPPPDRAPWRSPLIASAIRHQSPDCRNE
ncbi:unnamed protein product [Lampetra fluviatilis]